VLRSNHRASYINTFGQRAAPVSHRKTNRLPKYIVKAAAGCHGDGTDGKIMLGGQLLKCCDPIGATVAIGINDDEASLTKLDAGNSIGKEAPPLANPLLVRRGPLLPLAYE